MRRLTGPSNFPSLPASSRRRRDGEAFTTAFSRRPTSTATGTEDQGLCFAEQWSRLNTIDPEFLFVTGWNEWIAQRQVFRGPGDPDQVSRARAGPGDTWFIDAYNQEFSRDIEPMKGGHTDNYYYQMIDGIRRYKGVRSREPSPAKTITMDGDFADWDDVRPEYRDPLYDTIHRNQPGWGASAYIPTPPGATTSPPPRLPGMTSTFISTPKPAMHYALRADPNWMLLFIDADRNQPPGGRATTTWSTCQSRVIPARPSRRPAAAGIGPTPPR